MTLIDGKQTATNVRAELKERAKAFEEKTGGKIGLAVVLVGEDPASKVYVRNKTRACEEVGVYSETFLMDESTTQEEVESLVKNLATDKRFHGILVQLPLPKHLNEEKILSLIPAEKDVDGFCAENIGNLALTKKSIVSCTPNGVMELLSRYNIDVSGKKAVVLGRSNIVGRPMALLLLNANATVTICHSKTQDLAEECKRADILVAAIGKPKFVTSEMVKEGAVVIDVGINRLPDGKLCGDVDFENVKDKASFITPVPGGVGPMTIAMLLKNTVEAAENS